MTTRVKKEGELLPWIIAAVLLASALSVGTYFFLKETKPPPPQVSVVFQPITTSKGGSRTGVKLYFPARDGRRLGSEARDVPETTDRTQFAREVVDELIRGPVSPELVASIPAAARVKSLFIDPSGTAYVNFSRELVSEYPGGAWTETLTIYSLTNTLTEDLPEIKQVQILVEGSVVQSLAGHIDISRPFAPSQALNKE
ncbi:MAG: GerMN domain-containing protein [Nitrospirota bacterium]